MTEKVVYLQKVCTAIAESNYYSKLLTLQGDIVSTLNAETSVIDTLTHTVLSKVLPDNVMLVILSSNVASATSGIAVLKALADVSTKTSNTSSLRKTIIKSCQLNVRLMNELWIIL
mmetsp:Transcript_12884/g.18401  ORF Transcript_12884/g.18401 Transcript_12884/m.18401 type:complete len:116 (-) Transcript_12884:1443-1790(-)